MTFKYFPVCTPFCFQRTFASMAAPTFLPIVAVADLVQFCFHCMRRNRNAPKVDVACMQCVCQQAGAKAESSKEGTQDVLMNRFRY